MPRQPIICRSFVLGLGTPPASPSDSHTSAAWGYTCASLGVLAAAVGGGYWYRRRRRANNHMQIHRFEPVALPINTEHPSAGEGPVEPFQMRKARLPFGIRNSAGGTSTDPLLTAQPPSYDSIAAEARVWRHSADFWIINPMRLFRETFIFMLSTPFPYSFLSQSFDVIHSLPTSSITLYYFFSPFSTIIAFSLSK